jgi:serine/threonine-protein kinase
MNFKTGDEVGGYLIVELLQETSKAVIYAASHRRLGREAMLKVIKPELTVHEEVIQRFFREARTISELSHPCIVSVFDLVVDDSMDPPLYYMVTEYLTGTDVHTLVQKGGVMDPERAVTITLQVAGALVEVHRANTLHRDLKPENVFVTEQDGKIKVKLTNFGFTKAFGGRRQQKLTEVGMTVGTPEFMSPEQILGKDLDQRADIYALGATLYDMLTGKPPFSAGNETIGEILHRQTEEKPPPISDRRPRGRPVPPALEAVVMRCLEKDPDDRFQTAEEMIKALVTSLGSLESVSATPPEPEPADVAPAKLPTAVVPILSLDSSNRPWIIGGGVALAAVVVVSLWFALSGEEPPKAAVVNDAPEVSAPAKGEGEEPGGESAAVGEKGTESAEPEGTGAEPEGTGAEPEGTGASLSTPSEPAPGTEPGGEKPSTGTALSSKAETRPRASDLIPSVKAKTSTKSADQPKTRASKRKSAAKASTPRVRTTSPKDPTPYWKITQPPALKVTKRKPRRTKRAAKRTTKRAAKKKRRLPGGTIDPFQGM